MYKEYSIELGGRTLTLEFGKYAEQASGSTFVRYGDTAVLVNATVAETPRPGIDFFPLSVDYEEKLYSVGHIPGSWNRREGRPGEHAILTSRLIDRPLRPLFPKGMRHDVAVAAVVMSVEQDNSPEICAMNGASAALCISEIPFAGPIGAVNVGYVDGEYIINPTVEQREVSLMNLTVAGTKEAVLMVEAGAKEVSEEIMLKGILFAHEQVKRLVEFQEKIVAEIGVPKREFPLVLPGDDVKAAVREFALDKVRWCFETFDRQERQAREAQVNAETMEHFAEQFAGRETEIGDALYALNKEVMRRHIIDDGVRPDGRKLTEVRPIWCEVGVLPRAHGSGVFTRGQTQVMTVATLAPMSEVQILDGIGTETNKRYMHHYNFPGYSTGEAKPLRSPGRREIGHGALAERALLPMIPSVDEFPYCLRLVSEVMSSNGSTSQASVCGSTLALMDAGVPIKRPVAGVAMGLIKDVENTGKVAVLTDIQGLEDFLGDMDFKVAGTALGIEVRAQDHPVPHRSREDRRGRRPARQDDQQDHRADRREDRYRGRRQRVHCHRGRRRGPEGQEHHRRHRPRAEGRRRVHRHCGAHYALRRVRRVCPRQGRHDPHFQAGQRSRGQGGGRCEDRRYARVQGRRDRRAGTHQSAAQRHRV